MHKRPIETAPKDGTRIRLFYNGGEVFARWHKCVSSHREYGWWEVLLSSNFNDPAYEPDGRDFCKPLINPEDVEGWAPLE